MLSKILSCIACEGVRQEAGGKATILGFAGVLPNAKVTVPTEGRAYQCFFISALGEGEVDLTFEMLDPSSAVIAEPTVVKVVWDGKDSVKNIVLSIQDVDLLNEGEYTITVLVDDQEVFKSSFQVKNPTPNV